MRKKATLALSLIIIFAFGCLTGCAKEVIVRPIQTAPAATQDSTPDGDKASYPKELSSEDVGDFENAFNDESNYGFLLSEYADVRDANLSQVFYIGAGLSAPSNADEIRDASLAEMEYSPDCDSTILTAQQVSDFLSEKTGYTLAEMSSGLTWQYIEAYDAYVYWHGDTNFVSISCTGGRQIAPDTYEIEYKLSGGFYDDSGNLLSGGMVTVRTSDNNVQFVSNSMHS